MTPLGKGLSHVAQLPFASTRSLGSSGGTSGIVVGSCGGAEYAGTGVSVGSSGGGCSGVGSSGVDSSVGDGSVGDSSVGVTG